MPLLLNIRIIGLLYILCLLIQVTFQGAMEENEMLTVVSGLT